MIAEYLTEALETDDEAFIAKAIGTVARAQGMGAVAEAAGVSRENLDPTERRYPAGIRDDPQGVGALGMSKCLVAKPRAA